MSYFEVYNEKIHDLLVFKAENGQKKQPVTYFSIIYIMITSVNI